MDRGAAGEIGGIPKTCKTINMPYKLQRHENETDEQFAIRNRVYRDKCNAEHRAYLAKRAAKATAVPVQPPAPVPALPNPIVPEPAPDAPAPNDTQREAAPIVEADPEIARLEKMMRDAYVEIKERRKQQKIADGTYRPQGRPRKNPLPAPEPPAPEPPAPEPPAPEPVRLSAAERMEQIIIDTQVDLFKHIMADTERTEREKILTVIRMVRGMAPRG
jgi:hypothetical protein